MKNTKAYSPRQLYLRSVKNQKIKVVCYRGGILLAIIVFWEVLTAVGILDSFFLSSPSRVFKTFISLLSGGEIFKHIAVTTGECIIAFALSMIVGFVVAVMLWWNSTARKVSEPYLVVLNALPKIALGPIIIIWMGANAKSIIAMGFLICIIVTVINVLGAFTAVDEGKIFLLRSMGASKFQILYKLVIPHSISSIVDTVKIVIGLAWVGVIMGEYLVSGAGLGYLIIYGGQVFRIDLVMASTVILCALASLMYFLVALLSKALRRYNVGV